MVLKNLGNLIQTYQLNKIYQDRVLVKVFKYVSINLVNVEQSFSIYKYLSIIKLT